jgi:hypothetical protein
LEVVLLSQGHSYLFVYLESSSPLISTTSTDVAPAHHMYQLTSSLIRALIFLQCLQAAAGGKSLALVGATVGSGGSAKGTANSGTSTRSSSSTGGNAGTDGDSGLFSRSTVLAFTGSIESDVDALFRRTEVGARGDWWRKPVARAHAMYLRQQHRLANLSSC